MATRGSSAAAKVARIPDDDPVLLAAMNAPVEDMPETEQEKRDVAEALATGRFIPGPEVSRMVAARRPR
ncbi:MAG: hypothetical protein QM820_25410 [Minicystis sp.]